MDTLHFRSLFGPLDQLFNRDAMLGKSPEIVRRQLNARPYRLPACFEQTCMSLRFVCPKVLVGNRSQRTHDERAVDDLDTALPTAFEVKLASQVLGHIEMPVG